MIKTILFWLENARVYSAAMTILSWLVAFLYGLKHNGNPILGIICLFGILLVHLATNLIDDYFDYKILTKNNDFINSAQDCKCKYLKTGQATTKDLKHAIFIFLILASFIGIFLFFASGYYVALLAIIALLIALIYQPLSLKGLGEIAVIIAYGPLMFEGIYYVMTKTFSFNTFILSIACAFFVNTVLYVHMLMDYDGDECSHKTTLCRKFKTKKSALNFIWFFYGLSYLMMISIALKTSNYIYLFTFLTLPLTIDLYRLLNQYNKDKTKLPTAHFWNLPLENWDKIKTEESATFYFLFFYSRNIVTWFMLLCAIAIICK